MTQILAYGFVFLVAFLIGRSSGWTSAHYTVATECERLGSFYVGKDVYVCSRIVKGDK